MTDCPESLPNIGCDESHHYQNLTKMRAITFIKLQYLHIFWVSVLLSLASCQQESIPDPEFQPDPGIGMPDLELFGAEVRFTQADRLRFAIKAGEIKRFEANDLLLLENGVEAHLYDSQGRRTAVLNSDEGDVVERDKSLTARGHVVVKSDSGMVLYTDTLYYDDRAGRIKSDGFVIVVSPHDSIAGYGFSATPSLSDWEIKNTSGATWRELSPRRRNGVE
ncbi:MAG: LPS export ABC transporter periplasmic protein LptC [Calditrichota bacterium]